MKRSIPNAAYETAYCLAKQVNSGEISQSEAAHRLRDDFQLQPMSATGFISVAVSMLKGECYKRTNRTDATRYYLDMIHADYGDGGLARAMAAVKQHTAYYAELNNGRGRPAIDQLLASYQERLSRSR